MSESFYWYDLETTGTNPKWDRIIQFAGVRTDTELNIMMTQKPSMFDYLTMSCLILKHH